MGEPGPLRGASTNSDGKLVLKLTSDPANLAPARHACEAYCRSQGLGDAAVADVGLCVNEAMANIMRHAYKGALDRPLEMVAEPVNGRCPGVKITLRDWGIGVNPLARPIAERDPARPGGLGLVCLRQLLDEATFEPQPGGGMLLTMVKREKC